MQQQERALSAPLRISHRSVDTRSSLLHIPTATINQSSPPNMFYVHFRHHPPLHHLAAFHQNRSEGNVIILTTSEHRKPMSVKCSAKLRLMGKQTQLFTRALVLPQDKSGQVHHKGHCNNHKQTKVPHDMVGEFKSTTAQRTQGKRRRQVGPNGMTSCGKSFTIQHGMAYVVQNPLSGFPALVLCH